MHEEVLNNHLKKIMETEAKPFNENWNTLNMPLLKVPNKYMVKHKINKVLYLDSNKRFKLFIGYVFSRLNIPFLHFGFLDSSIHGWLVAL